MIDEDAKATLASDEDRGGDKNPESQRRLSASELFFLFARMSLVGFGGVMPWTHRILVEKRRLMTPAEYAEMLAFAQLLPGPTICNLAVVFGYRHAGIWGAVSSLAGMVGPPVLLVVCLGVIFQRYGGFPLAKDALKGMAIVSAAMVAAMALRLSASLERTAMDIALSVSMFAGVALLRQPLVLVVAILAGAGILIRRWQGVRDGTS